MAAKPTTQKETIDQLWYAVIGTNGTGLVGRMAKLEEEFDNLREACRNNGVAKNGKKPRRLEILTGVMALLLGLQTLGIFEGVRQAIVNWLAG